METDAAEQAYEAQVAASRHLFLHHFLFKLRLQHWYRLHRHCQLVIELEINTDGQRIGLFAELNRLLYAVHYAESVGGKPVVHITSKTYSFVGDGCTDYLQQYFDLQWPRACVGTEWRITKRISSLSQLPHFSLRTQGMSLWRANQIATKYLAVNKAIQDDVNSYINDELGSDFIAVHWRGTDKYLEAGHVSALEIAATIFRVYQSMKVKPGRLFIASDEQDLVVALVSEMASLMPGVVCVWRDAIKRSSDGSALHLQPGLSGQERYDMGRNALIDALIMSRARALVRTSSFLSAWCLIWNPVLPMFMVNAPMASKTWFPDSEILLSSQYHYLHLVRSS